MYIDRTICFHTLPVSKPSTRVLPRTTNPDTVVFLSLTYQWYESREITNWKPSAIDTRAAMARFKRSCSSRSCSAIVFMAVIGADSNTSSLLPDPLEPYATMSACRRSVRDYPDASGNAGILVTAVVCRGSLSCCECSEFAKSVYAPVGTSTCLIGRRPGCEAR
jgi:hypothetical protein